MGFLDAVESIISNICSTVEEHNNRVQNYTMRYEHLDDQRLFEKMKQAYGAHEKLACRKLLLERGYDENDIGRFLAGGPMPDNM